jgi:hypothetical protein
MFYNVKLDQISNSFCFLSKDIYLHYINSRNSVILLGVINILTQEKDSVKVINTY